MNNAYKIMLKAFDAPLSQKEQEILNAGWETSARLRRDHSFFVSLRSVIYSTAFFSFEPAFVQRVVESAFSTYDEFGRWVGISFRRVAVAAAMLSLACAFHNISVHGSADLAALFGQPEPSIDHVLQVERFLPWQQN